MICVLKWGFLNVAIRYIKAYIPLVFRRIWVDIVSKGEMFVNQWGESFTPEEQELLKPFVTNLDSNVFVFTNLPEVIKGALFSRYSRSAKGLRRLLLDEFILNPEVGFQNVVSMNQGSTADQVLAIQKAQDFYDRILDGYGDDSIGELGGAHVALENISVLATKAVEDCRIGGSPLEKSTRYVLFDKKINGKYMFYEEPTLLNSKFAQLYLETMNFLFSTYAKLVEPMILFLQQSTPKEEGVSDAAYKSSLRSKACDVLRSLLPAGHTTNMGVFGNGRFFETLLMKMRCDELAEVRELADKMQIELNKVIPSFVRRGSPDNKHFTPFKSFIQETRKGMQKAAKSHLSTVPHFAAEHVELVSYDVDAEVKVLASMLYPYCHHPMSQLRRFVRELSEDERKKLIHEYMGRRENRRHKPGRALENTFYTFDMLGNFAIYKDLERHRMLTQERQDFTIYHGYDIPKEIVDAGFEREFRECMEAAKDAFVQIAALYPKEAQYVVPYAYKLRWYNLINLRSVYWMSELRSQRQGHPDYRKVAQLMYVKIRAVHPALAEYMKFVDMNDYSLARLEAEMRKEKQQKTLTDRK